MTALSGLRVIELADEQGEWAGKLLADMGADVVKVEPLSGSRTRRIGPFVEDLPGPERSLHFWHYNTSKRSVTLDIQTRQGRGILLQLTAGAHAVVDTSGLHYESHALANPDLVWASISPWGPDGPYAHFASGDLIQMAMGGIVASCGYDDHDVAPVRPGVNHAHHLAGWHAVVGILAALHAGVGQHVEVAVHDCVGVCTEFAATHWFYTRALVQRQTGRHATVTPTARSLYPARNGKWVNLTTVDENAFEYFASFAEEAGVDLSKFRDDEGSIVRGPGLGHALRAVTSILDSEEVWLTGQSLGMTWGAVRAPEDWLDDPHAAERGFFQEVDYPEAGAVKQAGPPFAFTQHPGRIRRAPRLGEHNAEVYGALGYTSEELTALAESGVI